VALAFNIVLNALLIAAMAFFVVALVALILATQEPLERALRAAAAFTGALVVLGAQASGISYANFIVKALEQNKTIGIGFLAAGLPAVAGVGIGWYFVHSMKRSDTLTIRLLAFIGMLATASFASVYVVALSKNGADLGKAAIPNISFAVALLLYVVLKIDTKATRRSRPRTGGSLFSRLANGMNRFDGTPDPVGKDRLR
jgi:magnesium-transporting ATPase (P-type)